MNIESADIVQIIVALIGFMGIVYSASQGKGKRESPALRSKEGDRAEKATPPKRLGPNIALWVSITLLAANFGILGWRYLGPTPPDCRLENLINCSAFVPISKGNGQITASIASGNLEIKFSNGQGYTGVVFQFTSALDVRRFTHVDISGTATQDFKLIIEYKVHEDSTARVVKSSEFHLFPAAVEASTIRIPLTFAGKVDEIALMFYVPDEASHVIVESVSLK
jgi:hypothetical protein